MTVSNVTTTSNANQIGGTSGQSPIRQARQDFEQIFQAIQSGNLPSAQQAYNDLQQIRAGSSAPTSTAGSSASSTVPTTSAPNPVSVDWTSLGQALNSGSLSSAQDAMTKLTQDASAQWQSQIQNAHAAYALLSGTSANTTASTATPNAVQTDLSNLQTSLQAGDIAGAQKLLAQLQQDLQSSGQTGQFMHQHHLHHDAASQTAAPTAATAAPTASTVSSNPTA